jgi:opacity protein-like surface antigen
LFTVVIGLIPGVGSALKGKIMKRLLLSLLLGCVGVCVVQAQENISSANTVGSNAAANFSATSAARVPLVQPLAQAGPLFTADTLDLGSSSAAGPATVTTALALPMASPNAAIGEPAAEPSPAPRPKFIYSDRDDFRWQLGLGVSFERFRSSIYSASAVGTTTSLAYFLSDFLGVEGNVNTFFAPTIWQNEHIKLVNYGFGPKFAWRRPRWEPWFHGLFGGTHALPQTGNHNSQNGFAVQLGGGADYRLLPRLSARAEVDYVGTKLFGQWQNNGQATLSLVFHF